MVTNLNIDTTLKTVAQVTADATLAAGTRVPANATSAGISLALPTGAHEGARIVVEKVDSTTNTVTITGSIRGTTATPVTLAWKFELIGFVADSTGSWQPFTGRMTRTEVTNRANHIGTQPSVSISDSGTAGRAILAAETQADAKLAMGVANIQILEPSDPTPTTQPPNVLMLRKVTDPSIRTVGAATFGNVSSLAHTVPTDAAVGDVLCMVETAGNFALTTPAGWTLAYTSITPTTSNQVSQYVFVKRCVSADIGSSVTVTGAGINRRIGLIFAVQDVSTTTMIDVAAGLPSEVTGTSHPLPSATTTMRGLPLVFAADRAGATTPASATWTWPAQYTGIFSGRGSANVNGGEVSLGIASGSTLGTASTAGGGSATGDQSSAKFVGGVVTFPAVAGT